MRFLALVAALSLNASAQSVPQTDASRKAAAELKVFTDQFKLAAPIPLYEGKKGYEDHFDFTTDFRKRFVDYRQLFLWDEDTGTSEQLTPEKFQLAYAKASDNGRDALKGAMWTCDFVEKLRGYFGYYADAKGRGDAGLKLLGTQATRVDMMHELVKAVAKRHKEASGIDLEKALTYNTRSECESKGEEVVKEDTKAKEKETVPPPGSLVELNKKTTPYDEGQVDFSKWRYFVFYYDASWQPWELVGDKSKRWKPTAEDFKKFVNCRAPEWVGSFVARTPRKDGEAVARTWKSGAPGEVLRHPLQPKSAKDRDPKLIAQHKKEYCPKK